MVTIIDYGVGNLSSIKNMLKKIGVESEVSSDPKVLTSAEKIILPGVGAFDTCAKKLKASGLLEVLNKKVLGERIPVLGVCVGMQLLMNGSEEGVLPGLGWIKGRNVKFRKQDMSSELKIPHMGWSDVRLHNSSRLFEGLKEEARFYFVHSFHALLDEECDAMVYASHGYSFVAGVEKENILGVQFHPEKSHKFGMMLLANFAALY